MSNILRSQGRGPDDVLENVSENLRRLRADHGISQERLSELTGLSRRMISAIESGAANVSLANVDKLAAALDVPFTRLVRDPDVASTTRLDVVGWRGNHPDSRAILCGSAQGAAETELWRWTLGPGEEFASEEIAGTWHEMIFVIGGELTIDLPSRADVVRAQDFRIFTCKEPYRFRNAGAVPVSYLRVLVL